MGSYGSGIGWSADCKCGCSTAEIDGHLAGAGYRVRSSDLQHVAQRLEQLESAMVRGSSTTSRGRSSGGFVPGAPLDPKLLTAAAEAIHYNPSDLVPWVDSMLSELSPASATRQVADHRLEPATWTTLLQEPLQVEVSPQQVTQFQEEDSGIRLVHLLVRCAESVQSGDAGLAGSLVEEMRLLLGRIGPRFGIGKVAGYFVDALSRRLYLPQAVCARSAVENEVLYHHFYEACPYLKFAHFTANQAILEAFEGHDFVHVIDVNLMHGLQWPALIQALALRPGGPPFLRLTGIGPPSPDGRDSLRSVGLRLAELARSVNVRFAFRGVAASRLDDVKAWMLQVAPNEAAAVNSVMQLHRLLPDPEAIQSVLAWIRDLRPKIVTVVEQEADHNKDGFLDRFTEALFYYSTMFDSLEGGGRGVGGAQPQPTQTAAEVYLQREICNIVCCEGTFRVERHEPLARWRKRLNGAGFRANHLGSNAFKQASMLLTLFSGEGYCIEEVDGCLTLGWHSRPLISASAWRADDVQDDRAGGKFTAAAVILNSGSISSNISNSCGSGSNSTSGSHHSVDGCKF